MLPHGGPHQHGSSACDRICPPGKEGKRQGGARIAQRHSCRDARSSMRLRLRRAAGSSSSGPSSSRVLTRSAKPVGSRKRSASSRARCAAISTAAASHAAAAAPPRAEPLPREGAATCGTDCVPRKSVPARGLRRARTARAHLQLIRARNAAGWHALLGASRAACQCVAVAAGERMRRTTKRLFTSATNAASSAACTVAGGCPAFVCARGVTRQRRVCIACLHPPGRAHRCALQQLRQL